MGLLEFYKKLDSIESKTTQNELFKAIKSKASFLWFLATAIAFWRHIQSSIKGNLEGKKLPKRHTKGLVKALNIKLRSKEIKQAKLLHYNFKALDWMW